MRNRSVIATTAAWVVSGLCGSALAQSFEFIPGPTGRSTSATGVSADGTIVGGNIGGAGAQIAFLWTRAGGRQDFGAAEGFAGASATALSGDGTTLVGRGPAFRYRGPGTYQSLGSFGPYPNAEANGVNGDGNVVVGEAFNSVGTSGEAWRWTPGGMQGLGRTRPGHTYSSARAVSRDGGTIVGFSGGGGAPTEAFLWTAGGGMQVLPLPVGDIFGGSASAVNHDGSIIVGNTGLPGSPPAIWRNAEEPTILPIPVGWANAGARVLSDDGTIVAGQARNPSFEQEAWIWTQTRGSESLMSYLTFQGVAVPAGWKFASVVGLSADGRTIVGVGNNPTEGIGGTFVATVPTPAVCVTICAAGLVTCKRKRLAAAT